MMTSVIFHNMIIEDKKELDLEEVSLERVGVPMHKNFTFQDFQQGTIHIENSNVHFAF